MFLTAQWLLPSFGDWVASSGGPVADARGPVRPVAGSLSNMKLMFVNVCLFGFFACIINNSIYANSGVALGVCQDQFCLL